MNDQRLHLISHPYPAEIPSEGIWYWDKTDPHALWFDADAHCSQNYVP